MAGSEGMIAMTESTKSSSGGDGAHRESKRVESQVTLSAIGDMSVAATEAVGRVAAAPRRTRWLPLIGFLLLVYIAGSLVAIYTLKSEPWVQAFVAPLPLVLIAALAFWRRQVWKFRARDWRFKEKIQQNALNSLAHETSNGVNAIRANLAGFSDADSLPSAAEHLKLVERSLERIDTALEKAIGQTPPKQVADPQAAAQASKSKVA
jgi:signal transduction histidine kinase